MKKIFPKFLAIAICCTFWLSSCTIKQDTILSENNETIFFEKSGEIVLNPGQGWVLYGIPGDHSSETLALGTTGYQRYDWCTLNPEEDVYNWAPLDDALNQWAEKGKQFSFGVMSVNTFGNYYATPEWVFGKGAKFTMGNNEAKRDEMKYFIPIWNDPVYVAASKKFAEALAARYDGNPNIAFIDIRNYGNWGELHMYPFERSTVPLTPDEVINLLFKPYSDSFKTTPLIICHPHTLKNIIFKDETTYDYDYDIIMNWAVDRGIGLRRDGIMGKIGIGGSDGDEITSAIGKTPIVWEFLGTFRSLETDPNRPWNDNDFIEIIQRNKPNYIGMGQWGNDSKYMLSKKSELVKRVANEMGFHFFMKSATYPTSLSTDAEKEISVTIENSGVTTILTDCVVKLALLNEKDEIISLLNTDWDLKKIKAEETMKFRTDIRFSSVVVGTYRLAIGLYLDERDQKPTYKMENKDRTRNGFYIIGNLRIK